MVKQILEWLETGQEYAQGVALYERFGKSRVILKSLRRGASEFTRQKLREELSKLSQAIVAEPGRAVVVDTSDKTPNPVPGSPLPPEPPDRRTWYATRAYAHAQLELVGTEAERCELAATILAMSEKIDASYRAAAAPADVVPDPDLTALTEEGEIRRLLANLRPQRTKLKKNPARARDLARVVAQITLLETKLKTRDGEEPQLHPRD